LPVQFCLMYHFRYQRHFRHDTNTLHHWKTIISWLVSDWPPRPVLNFHMALVRTGLWGSWCKISNELQPWVWCNIHAQRPTASQTHTHTHTHTHISCGSKNRMSRRCMLVKDPNVPHHLWCKALVLC